MKFNPVPIWKEAPFVRYIIPFMIGIIWQWNYNLSFRFLIWSTIGSAVIAFFFNFFKLTARFRYYYLFATGIYFVFFFIACLLTSLHDVRNNKEWIGNYMSERSCLIVSIEGAPSERSKSYKVQAIVEKIIVKGIIKAARGKVLLYLKKDSNSFPIEQGSRLLITSALKPVENFANSTGFDYRRYCSLQQIYHQGYLKNGQYILLPGNGTTVSDRLLSFLRNRTVSLLRTYIKGKKEAGLAEALLIGYKDDLDKELIQSYSNTGVVHIIAISGLHVALIYSILLLILKPFTRWRCIKKASPVVLLSGLWLFSLVAGGSPSVLRSALMLSVIVIGKTFSGKSSVYNCLAISAFFLLCYNPLWIYDTGFQLSYLAVLSLVIFTKMIYNKIYVQNKLLDLLWKMTSVTLAAQILTTPICLYYFHRFPNMFLITNMVAVPLSSLILIGEILLCVFSPFPMPATFIGEILAWLIRIMNNFIGYTEKLPFAVTENLHISIYQVIILYIIIIIITGQLNKADQKY